MNKIPVIAIFDVGKTNKKLLLFDKQYHIVYEENKRLDETVDEDEFPCEDVHTLTEWIKSSFNKLLTDEEFEIKAVNFSAYGASFVCLDKDGKVVAPLYNYLKPYPLALRQQFYASYGGESLVARQTASPVLGNLNSGMQLYRLKYERPELFDKIEYALHLPQYLSYILSGVLSTDITSIGCHTNLWNFEQDDYHQWVREEQLIAKFPPMKNSKEIAGYTNGIAIGIGLHDSSAALIPYLSSFTEPFILISTGTWCITLNPFNLTPLTDYELQQGCLCYLSYEGTPVKASRLFAGYEHEQQVQRLAEYFKMPIDHYKNVSFDAAILKNNKPYAETTSSSYEIAYHRLMADILKQQIHSSALVLKGIRVKKIFVDGGFSNNPVYMQLLAEAFPEMEVYAATMPQASALGAAMAVSGDTINIFILKDYYSLQKYEPSK